MLLLGFAVVVVGGVFCLCLFFFLFLLVVVVSFVCLFVVYKAGSLRVGGTRTKTRPHRSVVQGSL